MRAGAPELERAPSRSREDLHHRLTLQRSIYGNRFCTSLTGEHRSWGVFSGRLIIARRWKLARAQAIDATRAELV